MSDTAQSSAPQKSTDDGFAAALRGFGPLGIFAIAVILSGNFIVAPLSAVLVLGWAALSRTPFAQLGFVRPRSWLNGLLVGIVFGIAFKFAMKAVVMPLLGAPPVNEAYHYLAHNPAVVPQTLFALTIGAGFGEETVFRGFMFERLGKFLGSSAVANTAIVLFTAAVFGLAHYSVQGLPGMEQAMITGTVFGTIFAISGRLYEVMVAHAAFDLTAYAMIYWDFETTVAHLVYR